MHFTNITLKLKDFFGDIYNPVICTIRVIGVAILAITAAKLGSMVIRKVFEKQKTFKYGIDSKRVDTMSSLLVSVFRYVVYIVAIITILSDIFELKSVLAAAGIGGIAVGLGAQSLIKDVISGFFILLEDQFAVGDLITVDNMNGTVEVMELRITKLRNFNGDLYIIPNGEIKKLTNHTRGNKTAIIDIPVTYSSDMGKAYEIASDVCSRISGELSTVVEPARVLGITELGKDSANLRLIAKTLPNEHWEVERRIRKLIRDEFSKAGIEFFEKNRVVMEEKTVSGGGGNG